MQPDAERTNAYRNRFLLSRRHNLCYAAVDKAACTTIKWWMAEVEGMREEVAAYLASRKGRLSAVKGVHHAYGYVAPHLAPRSFAQIRAVFESGRYFCFSVVRNPYARVFSAWSDKILKGRHDITRFAVSDAVLFCDAPLTVEDVRLSFEAFVGALHDSPGMIRANRHWIPQFLLLRPDLLRYDRIAPLENPEELKAALRGVLGESYKDPLARGEEKNTSKISYHPDFITDKAASRLQRLYADDFRWFGYDPLQLPPGKSELDSSAVEEILASLLRQRISYSYSRLARLEQERRALHGNPIKAFRLFLRSLAGLLRLPAERARYAVLSRLKK